MARNLDNTNIVWPKPRIMLVVTRVDADMEGVGVELTEGEFKEIFETLYWAKNQNIALVNVFRRVWDAYLRELRSFLVQRSFGLYARVPWSMTKTKIWTEKLRKHIFGEGNDERQVPGLFSSRVTQVGPILQADAVRVGLGTKKAGFDSKPTRRVARGQRVSQGTGGDGEGRRKADGHRRSIKRRLG